MSNKTTHRIVIDVIGPKLTALRIRDELIALLDSIRPLDAAYSVGRVQSPPPDTSDWSPDPNHNDSRDHEARL